MIAHFCCNYVLLVSASGIDNSIGELDDSGEALQMIIPDTHNALYARSSSRNSLEEKKQVYRPKSDSQENGRRWFPYVINHDHCCFYQYCMCSL